MLFLIGCSNDRIIHAYVVVKSNVQDNTVDEWQPVMKVTYRVGENTVISEVAGLLDKYEDCSVKNIYNWQCEYEDGTGKNAFGFSKASYWRSPSPEEDIRHVSRWEYNLIRCKWFQHDYGRVAGISACLKTYI